MYGICKSCGSRTHVRKFPDHGNKTYCRACSDTNLGHSDISPKDFNLKHLAQSLGQLYNQLNDRLMVVEQKLKIEPDNKLPIQFPDKKK